MPKASPVSSPALAPTQVAMTRETVNADGSRNIQISNAPPPNLPNVPSHTPILVTVRQETLNPSGSKTVTITTTQKTLAELRQDQ